ncbi:MAG: phosphoenolpyruvate--protein phosphotransferase, partial [Burkholderiaceae bacterium]|nr:phosphoenolpyruvate--protein phosphotransferase [Burkholderiaceae bacterium]
MFSISGTGIGGGIVIGRARVLESRRFDVARYHIAEDLRPAEFTRLREAIDEVKRDIAALAEELPADAPSEARALLEVHSMILDDPSLADAALDHVIEQGWNAEWAVSSQADHLANQFAEFDDPYLRERGRDVQQVTDRVLK